MWGRSRIGDQSMLGVCIGVRSRLGELVPIRPLLLGREGARGEEDLFILLSPAMRLVLLGGMSTMACLPPFWGTFACEREGGGGGGPKGVGIEGNSNLMRNWVKSSIHSYNPTLANNGIMKSQAVSPLSRTANEVKSLRSAQLTGSHRPFLAGRILASSSTIELHPFWDILDTPIVRVFGRRKLVSSNPRTLQRKQREWTSDRGFFQTTCR